ncbi:MAG: hypothetical protein ACR2O4_15570 [Hyphomicrobiaceae bacterium]
MLGATTSSVSAKTIKTVDTVEGWTIKSRTSSKGVFLTCSMERFFVSDKGQGKFRINIIAWPESMTVLLRGNDGFLKGKGIARFEVVDNRRELFSGNVRFQKSELLFAINGIAIREDIKQSAGWTIRKNGKRLARFPMTGAAAAMTAVEKCAGLSQPELPARPVVTASLETEVVSHGAEQQLLAMAQNFSLAIDRPDYRPTRFENGVLHWSYGDGISSAAATIRQQEKNAATYAAGLAIRADECGDSVLTLPISIGTFNGGERATVVSMCRAADGVQVRHVHVVTVGSGTTYVLNYETISGGEAEDIPEASDHLSGAFQNAFHAAVGG